MGSHHADLDNVPSFPLGHGPQELVSNPPSPGSIRDWRPYWSTLGVCTGDDAWRMMIGQNAIGIIIPGRAGTSLGHPQMGTRPSRLPGAAMPIKLYLRRLAIMLLIAMPITVVALAIVGLVRGTTHGAFNAVGGAFILVYMWGAVTAVPTSLLHTALTRERSHSHILVVGVGLVLGLIAGAFTPTPFTGIFTPAAIWLGGLAGLVYALLVESLPFARRDLTTA